MVALAPTVVSNTQSLVRNPKEPTTGQWEMMGAGVTTPVHPHLLPDITKGVVALALKGTSNKSASGPSGTTLGRSHCSGGPSVATSVVAEASISIKGCPSAGRKIWRRHNARKQWKITSGKSSSLRHVAKLMPNLLGSLLACGIPDLLCCISKKYNIGVTLGPTVSITWRTCGVLP